MGRLWVAIGKFTEVEDVVKALHAALPKECQERPWQKSGRRTQARDMIDNLLKCGSKIDPAKALENLINEQIEDYYYGNAIGKPGKWLNQKTGAYTGGTRLVGATLGEVMPGAPKVNLTDPDAGWLLIREDRRMVMAYRKKSTRKAAPKRSYKRKAAPKRKASSRARSSAGTTTIRIEMVHPAGAPSVASPMVPKVQSVKRARF